MAVSRPGLGDLGRYNQLAMMRTVIAVIAGAMIFEVVHAGPPPALAGVSSVAASETDKKKHRPGDGEPPEFAPRARSAPVTQSNAAASTGDL